MSVSSTTNIAPESTLTERPFRVLCLDGGGAKGFYTLGVLDEIEKNTGQRLHKTFDLVFGTSTGAIIATLVALGEPVASILELYATLVPPIMKPKRPEDRMKALTTLAETVFGKRTLADLKTRIGIVATNWKEERPFIFKASVEQAHGSTGSFVPFFGCTLAQAVTASCSAYPFFDTITLETSKGPTELGDGGFCANNPTLYAIADATKSLRIPEGRVRLLSVGVGLYPPPPLWKKARHIWGGLQMARHALNSAFLQKLLDTNTGSMDQLRFILYKDIATVRVNDAFVEPAMATDLLEHDLAKLNRLTQKGRISYQRSEREIQALLKG